MAGTKVKFNGVNRVLKNLKKVFNDVKKSNQLNKEMGKLVVNRIQLQARRGKPMKGIKKADGVFPSLTEFTMIARKLYGLVPQTHRAYRNARRSSNVTITGQLVDAVSFKKTANGVEVFIRGNARVPYDLPDISIVARAAPKSKVGQWIGVLRFLEKLKDPSKSNSRVYKDLLKLDKDYAFLNVNAKVQKSLNVLVLRFLRRALRKQGF